MAKNNMIVLSAYPRGRWVEGFVKSGETHKPGMVLQIDPTVALNGGRNTYKLYDRAADGDRFAGPAVICVNNYLQQGALDESFAAGAHIFGYVPEPGDELNLLLGDVAGTGDTHLTSAPLYMPDDGTGKWVKSTGSPQTTVAMLMENVTPAITADTLAWFTWGHS